MKKIVYLFIMIVLGVFKTNAQNDQQAPTYTVPAAYKFDYKVVYEINDKHKRSPETVSFYFPSNGEYMSMETPESKNDDDELVVITKDGNLVSFSREAVPNGFGIKRKVLKVIDMKSMYKGIGEIAAAFGKEMPDKDKADKDTDASINLDNFVKTGKTKNVFGYTAEEYSKHVSGVENGKERSGTVYVWYATVDFDPEMMFSMGLGALASGESQAKIHYSQPNNLLGMGISGKNYLLTELDFIEDNGKSENSMKVTDIGKTDFTKATTGYYVENYSGMSLTQMMEHEMGKGK